MSDGRELSVSRRPTWPLRMRRLTRYKSKWQQEEKSIIVHSKKFERRAHLTSVREFSPNDPSRRDIKISVIKNDRRTLSTQFESDGSKVFSSSFRNDSTDVSRSSVEDVIELEFEESRSLIDSTGNALVSGRIEVFGKKSSDESRSRGSLFSGLRGKVSVS